MILGPESFEGPRFPTKGLTVSTGTTDTSDQGRTVVPGAIVVPEE